MSRRNLIDFTWGHANAGGQHDWPFVMALQQGFFLDEGINLQIRVVPGGDALAAAMGRGEIQLGRMGTPPFLTAVSNGVLAGRIVASSVIHNLEHFVLVVRPEIETLRQLRGKTIGVLSRGSCDGHLLKLQLKRSGLDPDNDVSYRELREDFFTIDGLASGELSAQLSCEPLVSLGEHAGVLRAVEPVSRVAPKFHWGLLVARDDFIAERPDLLRRLLSAYLKGARFCVDHPDETRAMVCDYMPDYAPEVVAQAVARALPIWNTSGQVDIEGLNVAVDTMRTLGAIKQPLNAESLVDLCALS